MSPLKVMQVGFAGAAPEMRYIPSGEAVANVGVATNDVFTGKDGEKKESTTWLNWEVWGKSAENFTKFVSKGRQLYIEGTIRNEKWSDKTTGEPRYRDKYVISYWKLLDRKPDEADAEGHGDNLPEPPSGT